MPVYKVKPEDNGPCCAPAPGKSEKHYPTVWIKASAEIIEALEMNKAATVTLKGVVVGLSSNQSRDSDRHELTLELREVEAYPDEETEHEDPPPKKDMKAAIDEGLGYSKK